MRSVKFLRGVIGEEKVGMVRRGELVDKMLSSQGVGNEMGYVVDDSVKRLRSRSGLMSYFEEEKRSSRIGASHSIKNGKGGRKFHGRGT